MMETENSQPTPELIESLPASSSWWTFFKTDLFGKNYANFKGRSSRKEWWAFWILVPCFVFLLGMLIPFLPEILVLLIYLFDLLYFIIPQLALTSRRCHDLNWSFKRALFPMLFLLFLRGFLILRHYFQFDLGGLDYVLTVLVVLVAIYSIFIAAAIPFFKGDRKDNRFGKNIY